MTEHTYLSTQERITCLAFEALAQCHAAQTPDEKLEHWQVYNNLCEGACRLRKAYHQMLRLMQQQRRMMA